MSKCISTFGIPTSKEFELYENKGATEMARILLSRAVANGGEIDWESDHFKDTPKRFAKMIKDLTTKEEFEFTTFPSKHDDMVIIKDIPFHSLCAHHVIPFIGYAHIGYIPNGNIAGLSKFGRLVKYYSAALTVQEELTATIAQSIENTLHPKGVIVVMEAEHLCMTLRGVQMPGARTTTSVVHGVFAEHTRTAKAEFLKLIEDRRR